MAVLLQIATVLAIIGTVTVWRVLHVLCRPRPRPREHAARTHLLAVLGSGGHTAEMLAMLKHVDASRYTHRTYIVSSGDNFSSQMARKFEASLAEVAKSGNKPTPVSRIIVVPRARKIHQGLLTTPWSCAQCLVSCIKALVTPWPRIGSRAEPVRSSQQRDPSSIPDVIMTNGPATAVIVVLASLILRFGGWPGSRMKMRTIYVESWARVRRLSLSGKILLRVVDRFLVQWDALEAATRGRAECLGCLVA